jgi:hypothetical protein
MSDKVRIENGNIVAGGTVLPIRNINVTQIDAKPPPQLVLLVLGFFAGSVLGAILAVVLAMVGVPGDSVAVFIMIASWPIGYYFLKFVLPWKKQLFAISGVTRTLVASSYKTDEIQSAQRKISEARKDAS